MTRAYAQPRALDGGPKLGPAGQSQVRYAKQYKTVPQKAEILSKHVLELRNDEQNRWKCNLSSQRSFTERSTSFCFIKNVVPEISQLPG